MTKINLQLNRGPYMCPVFDDHLGKGRGQYIFHYEHIGCEWEMELLSESDEYWEVKLPTQYEEDDGSISDGWLHLELSKTCFDII